MSLGAIIICVAGGILFILFAAIFIFSIKEHDVELCILSFFSTLIVGIIIFMFIMASNEEDKIETYTVEAVYTVIDSEGNKSYMLGIVGEENIRGVKPFYKISCDEYNGEKTIELTSSELNSILMK